MRYQDIPQDQRALIFPTSFLIKAIGITEYNIRAVLLNVLEHHHTEYAVDSITELGSKHGKYLSVTVSITARSRRQLDDIYEDLDARPEIVMTI
jgi:putative lipoic acid-binding regulatory protein